MQAEISTPNDTDPLPPSITNAKDELNDRQAVRNTDWDHSTGVWSPSSDDSVTIDSAVPNTFALARNGKLTYFIDLPELASYVGLPASIYVGIWIDFSSNSNNVTLQPCFDVNKDWSLTIDTGEFLDDAKLTPVSLTVKSNFAYLACWVWGKVKEFVGTPRVHFEVDTFWLPIKPHDVLWWGTLLSTNSVIIEGIGDVPVLPDGACEHCEGARRVERAKRNLRMSARGSEEIAGRQGSLPSPGVDNRQGPLPSIVITDTAPLVSLAPQRVSMPGRMSLASDSDDTDWEHL